MSYQDQEEPSLPINGSSNRSTADLLPKYYRTSGNKKFLQATLDQLMQPGKVRKVNGYIGRQSAKAVKSNDIFVTAADKVRQDYQLEPTAIIQDDFENVTFFKDYIDYINQISVFGGDVSNHEILNKQESYSWNPHINWDKFVNFQNYYWLPYGPDEITVFGQQQQIISEYTLTVINDDDNYAYVFSPDGLTRNPVLTLFRGQTYKFKINTPDNPFSIKTSRTLGDIDRYTNGVSVNGIEIGTVVFTISKDAPDVLFYVSEKDANVGGVFQILDIEENTFLDVEKEIIGKRNYTMSNGIPISNGMKLQFGGKIAPEKYSEGSWYVEGVGTAIHLISKNDLEIIGSFSEQKELLFDDIAFDIDPFGTATSFPANKDYITINRASLDRSPWARYNRWFHADVITASAQSKNKIPEFDQSKRANRPIIEFDANLKLYNFGHKAKKNVNLIDTFTTDVFSTIEGSLGYNIDGIPLVDGMRVLFVNDPDILVKDRIFKVNFIEIITPGRQITFNAATTLNVTTDEITFISEHGLSTGDRVIYLDNGNGNINGLENRRIYYVFTVNAFKIKLYADRLLTVPVDIFAKGIGVHKFEVFSGKRRQINLVEDEDSIPLLNETVLVQQGVENQGKMYWYTGTEWKLGQQKTKISQPPLFDVFDNDQVSYGDTAKYDGSNFSGTKIFSYKVGKGNNDSVLGFPLSYKNINNVGDIVFEFDLLADSFNYKVANQLQKKNTDIGYLRLIQDLDQFTYENGWTKNLLKNIQPIVRIYKESNLVNNFPIDVYDDVNQLDDLEVKVYKNGIRVNKDLFTVDTGIIRKFVRFFTDVTVDDVITLKCYAKQKKNSNGYYEIPLSLQNNPLNDNLKEFTLGEVIDHVSSIVDNITDFTGNYPGNSNIRDLGNITPYGTRFLQHSGPLNLALYHFGQKNFNIMKALDKAREDYGKFKRAFLIAASNSGIQTETREHVDIVLSQMSKDNPKNSPYYLSDMFAFGAKRTITHIVEDPRLKLYSMSKEFNLTTLSNMAVYVYLNGEQLISEEYTFYFSYVNVLANIQVGDVIEVVEYENTDGCFCPPTPTKLGLFGKYEPRKFIDDTYLEPREVIQGHDGSIFLCYGDYRDDMLLELEKRIYNNIKIQVDPDIFNVYDFIPGYSRETDYSKEEYERVLSKFFFQWTTLINEDYTQQIYWDRLNPFTWNFRGQNSPDGRDVPAFWRGVYKWLIDTDRPHTNPWECLGYSVKPEWWEDVYGPAPYTSDNLLLWEDIRDGIIREPGQPVRVDLKFVKPIIENGPPVDSQGKLIAPSYANYVQGPVNATPEGYFTFGDRGPVETAWRRSSYYPFALLQTFLLLKPNHVLATCLDRSRIKRNLNNQLIYSETESRLRLKDIILPSTINDAERVYTAGLINYIVDYINSDVTKLLNRYKEDLQRLTNKIGSKLGAFTSKPKFNLLLDSKSPTSTGGVFVPQENYNIFLNTSSPVKKLVYSGIIITKFPDGFEIRGYNIDDPYFTYHPWRLAGNTVRVGGISESYLNWDSEKNYVAGKIVQYNGSYYRVKTNHVSGDKFDQDFYAKLAGLPQTGGREVVFRKGFDLKTELYLAYGTKIASIQGVVDFIQGYAAHLENQGFVFDDYNPNLKSVANWETSIKEFLFWTTQNWDEGAVIALSPCANKIVLTSDISVVNDIKDSFYGYRIYRVDGQLLDSEFTNVYRQENEFILAPENSVHGIYGAVLYLIQKEHAVVLDNTTLFNDVIYDLEPGYRQERIKVLGYLSTNWNGSFNIPGFIFDQANLTDWELWTDYRLGDIVRYKEFYYSAKKFIPGAEKFNFNDWYKLDQKPTPQLLPNWDYKSEQFTDFYDLDTDNFDSEQQRLAQHLIGYQQRQYLTNIIKDDVSQYKFYQGMIVEKGTQNVLTKLFDTLSSDNQESLTFNEEWALRVGEFGAVDGFAEVEFRLDENLFRIVPQAFELTEAIQSATLSDYVIRQKSSDLYLKPQGYSSNLWPIETRDDFLRTPGYVRYDDVTLSIDSLDEIVNYDIDTLMEGDYIWCAFENDLSKYWNVYRLTKTTFRVTDIEYVNNQLKITTDILTEFSVGDIIGIDQADFISGFYKISSVELNNIFVQKEITELPFIFTDSSAVLTYKFIPSRLTNINLANDSLPENIKKSELLWVDDSGEGLARVYENNKVYERISLENPFKTDDFKWGIKVSLSADGKFAAVTADDNQVYVFNKSVNETKWTQTDILSADLNISSPGNLGFGYETAFSPDGEWLAVAAPTASLVKSNDAGEFSAATPYFLGDIVRVRNTHWSAVSNFIYGDSSLVDGQNEFKFRQDWVPAYLVTTNPDKTGGYSYQGYVNLYKKYGGSKYSLVHSFVSPQPVANEKFGSKMSFAKYNNEYVLAISSPGFDNNRGRVYMFRYGPSDSDSTVSAWRMDYDRNYVGAFSQFVQYYPGDIVFNPENYELYRCLALQDPCPIDQNPSAWELLNNISILGYFPTATGDNFYPSSWFISPLFEETVEQIMPGDIFGYDIDISKQDGLTLVISSPEADDNIFYPYKGYYKDRIRYSKGDVVFQYGGFWKYNLDFSPTHTNSGPPPNTPFNANHWDIIYTPTHDFQGTFNSNIPYAKNDIVVFNNYLWIAIEDIPGDGSPINDNWSRLFVGEQSTGKVFVYKYNGTRFELTQTLGYNPLTGVDVRERFGESVAISDRSEYLAIGSILTDRKEADQGRVKIYKNSNQVYSSQQDLYSVKEEKREKFGAYLEFMNDNETLVVFAAEGDIENETVFDFELTTFDNGSLRIIDKQIDTGRVDIYDKFGENFIYGESLSTPTLDEDSTVNDETDRYGFSIAVGNNNIIVSAPFEDSIRTTQVGRTYSYKKAVGSLSWTVRHQEKPKADVYKIKKVYLYNKVDNQLVTYLDVVDPIQGKIPGPADQEIKFKTYFDPAVYTVGTSVVNVDEGMDWANKHVGMLWWDLSRARFIDYSVGGIIYRSTNWNQLYKTSSIDVYEWVETNYLPSEWNLLSGTEQGFSLGISGISKYGDDIYSVKRKYDSVSQTFSNTYYYWVRNPSLLPTIEGRTIPASDVSNLIADPSGYGYPCLALTGTDSFNLVNVKPLLEDRNVVLNVQYWLIDDQTKNVHSQWKIVSENINTIIPKEIEDKWINSLIGKDTFGRLLPDPKLPTKLKYGIESRPRQSMFVNRVEALKEFIERVNSVLIKNLIVDEFDLTDLQKVELPPTVVSGVWDVKIDTEEELRFIGTARLRTAILTPVITGGRITGIEVISGGSEYKNAPYIAVKGSGRDAVIKAIINDTGNITGAQIIESGAGYDSNTTLLVRPFSVLILSDTNSLDKWSIAQYNNLTKTWDRVRTQSYNVTLFWDYIDWYDIGYNQYLNVNYTVANTYELASLESDIGSIVKVDNIGTGGWLLLEKYNNKITIDYTENYKVIGRQNGTIKFKSSLYNLTGTSLGYDGSLFDSGVYDAAAGEELRIITNTIKDKILVDNLRTEYLKLFFASLRYAFKEQYFIDWAIKTSFVKSIHHVGDLTQKVTYNSDNLQDFESYVKEVKPYRTKVREYVSAYTNLEQGKTSVTDFDLPPIINDEYKISSIPVEVDAESGDILFNDDELLQYPWKHWYDNLGFTITSISIVDGGSGYINRPEVRILGGFGTGASAKAYISNGKVNRIDLINAGSGYLKAPTIVIDGGLASTSSVPARAVAFINNSLVRSNKISIKFDRITRNYYITDLEETETFTGSGSRLQFPLKFSPVSRKDASVVTINGNDVLKENYKLSTKQSSAKGYVSYSGLLTFNIAPESGSTIRITYHKNFEHLSAADRINFYYNPETGQLGKDLAQLMQGIDFGGVNIVGLDFAARGGWDSLPWYSEGWDGFDAEFDDYVVVASDSAYEWQLPYVPAIGQEINVYINGRRIDDPYFDSYDGIISQPNGRKVPPDGTYMQTWVGDGITDVIILPNLTNTPALDINQGDKIIFRKSTSDGAYAPDPVLYDTALSGGNLAYSTATGLSADDISLDGEGFITPAYSHAPEEIVPGHVADAVAIKVFRLPRSGPSKIYFENFVCDGIVNEFILKQWPNSKDAILVKLDFEVLIKDTDYTFDWNSKTITLTNTPADDKILNVVTFGFGSLNVLDTGHFISDGSTVEYITNAPWPTLVGDQSTQEAVDRLGSIVLIDGEITEYSLFKTDARYENPGVVGIRFGTPAPINSVVNFIINADANQTLTTVRNNVLIPDGSSFTYNLVNMFVGESKPYESNVIVIKNGEVLACRRNVNFLLQDNILDYPLPEWELLTYDSTANPNLIRINVDGIEITLGSDWTFDINTNTIKLDPTAYKEGARMQYFNMTDAQYMIDDFTITFISDQPPVIGDDIRIISFYNHDTQKIIRNTEHFEVESQVTLATPSYFKFHSIKGGRISLYRSMLKDDYIWVIKNNKLLAHSIDFYLAEDHKTIVFEKPLNEFDVVDIILFGDDYVTTGFGWMQFKDMLNRVHYKRINKLRTTRLTQELGQKDTQIFVQDSSVLSNPNKGLNLPGIIEINGERIEYFQKNGNILSQLRRGTLGTGVPNVHLSNNYVIDIGITETIPYQDQHIVETFVSDGSTNILGLNYQLESVNEIDVFVGGYRLKKAPYKIFGKLDEQGTIIDPDYPDSPEGDITLPAEFSVSGNDNYINLIEDAPENSKIVVVKKIGKVWEDPVDSTEIYRNIPAPLNGASFDIIKNQNGYTLFLKSAGSNYQVGNTIVLPGANLGGSSPENDITIIVDEIDLSRGIDLALDYELYHGSVPIPVSDLQAGIEYYVTNPGNTNWTTVGVTTTPVTVGTIFIATGPGIGSGVVIALEGTEGVVTLSLPTGIIAPEEWIGRYFVGNGAEGQIISVFLNQIFVNITRPFGVRAPMPIGSWRIYTLSTEIRSIVRFSYTGIARFTGYKTTTIMDSNNKIADFLKNTPTVWPAYIPEPLTPMSFNFDSELITFDDNDDTSFDQG
jgi:hypothetical protein